jgi:Bacterial low temperature requirement A protein (LtrA)
VRYAEAALSNSAEVSWLLIDSRHISLQWKSNGAGCRQGWSCLVVSTLSSTGYGARERASMSSATDRRLTGNSAVRVTASRSTSLRSGLKQPIVFSMWWLYFEQHADERLSTTNLGSFVWGYGHYFIFASAAGVGAGLQVAVDHASGHSALPAWGATATVAVPVALYLLSVWLLHTGAEPRQSPRRIAYPATAALVLAEIALGEAVVVIGLPVAALAAVRLLARTPGPDTERP